MSLLTELNCYNLLSGYKHAAPTALWFDETAKSSCVYARFGRLAHSSAGKVVRENVKHIAGGLMRQHAHATTRNTTRRIPFMFCLLRSKRLRWLALCVAASLLMSSCVESRKAQHADRREESQAGQVAQNAPAPPSTQTANANTMAYDAKTPSASPMSADQPPRPRPEKDEQEFNTEAYSHIEENPFLDVTRAPLSTFSIDVDTASYSNMRRFLNEGHLPPKDAVRIEELINYFNYDYPQPVGDAPFSVTTEVAQCPWNSAHRLVHVGLQGKRLDRAQMPPANLVFLLDVSGSMNEPN